MAFKHKLLLVVLTICTLGLFLLTIKKKKVIEPKKELSTSKTNINIKKLTTYLGGEENISTVSSTYSKVKFTFEDKKKIDHEQISKMKSVSGTLMSSNAITIIVGNQAKELQNEWETLHATK